MGYSQTKVILCTDPVLAGRQPIEPTWKLVADLIGWIAALLDIVMFTIISEQWTYGYVTQRRIRNRGENALSPKDESSSNDPEMLLLNRNR